MCSLGTENANSSRTLHTVVQLRLIVMMSCKHSELDQISSVVWANHRALKW